MVELEFTRTYAAPRQLVWDAWTDPDQMARWWGPRGVSTPRESIELDLRPGGRIAFDMVDDATGNRYPNTGTFLDVQPPVRIAWSDDGFPDGSGKGTTTVTFVEDPPTPPPCTSTSSPTSPTQSGQAPRTAGAPSSKNLPSTWRADLEAVRCWVDFGCSCVGDPAGALSAAVSLTAAN